MSTEPDAPRAGAALGAGCAMVLAAAAAAFFLASLGVEGAPSTARVTAISLPLQSAALVGVSAGMAALSRGGAALNLAWRRPPARAWALVPLVVAVGHLSERLVSWAGATWPGLDQGSLGGLEAVMATGGWVTAMAGIGAVVGAPLGEELLFRGYVYRGFERSLGAAAAIGLSAVAFAAYHMDPLHMIGVLGLGLWLGWLRWISGSVWPPIAAHMLNNAVWVVAVLAGAGDVSPPGWVTWPAIGLIAAGVAVSRRPMTPARAPR